MSGGPRAAEAQPEPDADSLVAFLHVPKCAGRTLGSLFREVYSKEGVVSGGNGVRFERDEKKRARFAARAHRGGARVMRAKVPYTILREQVPPGARYVTFHAFARGLFEERLARAVRHVAADVEELRSLVASLPPESDEEPAPQEAGERVAKPGRKAAARARRAKRLSRRRAAAAAEGRPEAPPSGRGG